MVNDVAVDAALPDSEVSGLDADDASDAELSDVGTTFVGLDESCSGENIRCERGTYCEDLLKTCSTAYGCAIRPENSEEPQGCLITPHGVGRLTTKECEVDNDCEATECILGVCQDLVRCDQQDQCEQDEECRVGYCLKPQITCETDNDCPEPLFCSAFDPRTCV